MWILNELLIIIVRSTRYCHWWSRSFNCSCQKISWYNFRIFI